jgi:hypothetical protein
MEQLPSLNASKIPAGYGLFPYVILQVYRNTFVQMPVVFDLGGNEPDKPGAYTLHIRNAPADALTNPVYRQKVKETLYEATKKIAASNHSNRNIANGEIYKDTACMVLSPGNAIYYQKGEFLEMESIPEGGALMNMQNSIMAINSLHYCSEAVGFM